MQIFRILLPVFITAFLISVACSSSQSDEGLLIMTVTGPINSSELDTTLVHEHVLVDWIGADSTGYHRWDRQQVVERVLPYFLEVKQKGVDTLSLIHI